MPPALKPLDSDKYKFGAGSDMQLYHDGTNSYITNSQGALKVATETSGIAITLGHSTSEVTVADNLTVTGTLTLGSGAELTEAELEFLDVVPSSAQLVGAEIELVSLFSRERMLKEALEDVEGKYKYIIIDSPPSLGLLTINVLTSAHTIIIPIQCEYYALEGLSQLLNTIRMVQKHLNKELEIEGILITMYDHRLNLSRQVVQELHEYFGDKVYDTYIKRNVRLGEAPSHGKPILLYDATSTGAHNYMNLVTEFLNNNG